MSMMSLFPFSHRQRLLCSFVLSLTQGAYLVSMKELVEAGGTLTGTIRRRVLASLSSVRKELRATKVEIHVYMQAPSQVPGNRQ